MGDELKPVSWRYDIQYGPEGETNYAWVYKGVEMIATMKTHHAVEVVETASALTALREECERLRKEAARATAEKTGLLEANKYHSGHDHGIMGIRSLVERAATLRALLAEATGALDRQRQALEPLVNAVIADNGDLTIHTAHIKTEHCEAAYFADRSARAVSAKIKEMTGE